MCCRLRLDKRELIKRGGGLFGANPQTGSIGVVTLNLPRAGHLARDPDDFIARLDQLMLLARNSLEIKRKVLEQFTERQLYPYTRFYLRNVQERHGCYWKNHFATIGLTGMNEACLNLIGQDIGTPEGQALAARVLDHMRGRLATFQAETGNLYNLEATPAEGTSFRLAKLDRQLYPDLVTAGTPEAPFYTNSTQLPVGYSRDIFRVLDLQDTLQTRYTGGTVQHIFLGESVSDPAAVKQFVRTVCSHYRLPYFTLTPTFSICPEHGYLRGERHACPTCGHETEVYSRVVGYLRPVSQWNEGKQEEFRERSTFAVPGPAARPRAKV
jgi:ribonucleoside-triphosphate reductase